MVCLLWMHAGRHSHSSPEKGLRFIKRHELDLHRSSEDIQNGASMSLLLALAAVFFDAIAKTMKRKTYIDVEKIYSLEVGNVEDVSSRKNTKEDEIYLQKYPTSLTTPIKLSSRAQQHHSESLHHLAGSTEGNHRMENESSPATITEGARNEDDCPPEHLRPHSLLIAGTSAITGAFFYFLFFFSLDDLFHYYDEYYEAQWS